MSAATDKAFDLLKTWEGYRATAYRDAGGVLTIGYGSTGPTVTERSVWDLERATTTARARLLHDEHILQALTMSRPPNDNQMAAFLSFVYNLGIPALEHSSLLVSYLAGDVQTAADKFLAWDHEHVAGKLVVVDGLENRRIAERALFLEPVQSYLT